MLRWFIGILVAVAGTAWYWQDDLWPQADARAASVVLERPTAGLQGAGDGEAARRQPPRLAGEQPSGGRPPIRQVLDRARALAASGQEKDAGALLRQRLAQPGQPEAMGRLAFELAGLTGDRSEQRNLIGRALRSGALAGGDYAVAHGMLSALNRNPRQGLLDELTTRPYEVRAGDSLWKICNKTLVTEMGVNHEPGLLRLVNGMSGDGLHAGQTLMVPAEPLRLEIDREGHGLVAWLGELPLMAYEVGLGKEGRTPSGDFVVEVKQENPTWYRDGRAIPHGDPENILGTRWMGFQNQPGVMGYGIHGTERPESIGLDESMGCVRMRNEAVESLFDIVARGTQVSIP